MIVYAVACVFEDNRVGDAWFSWLLHEHLADVCAAGALSADVVRVMGAEVRYVVEYRFSSMDAFRAYEQDHAPRLRSEGLRRFPLELGLRYERWVGEVLTQFTPG